MATPSSATRGAPARTRSEDVSVLLSVSLASFMVLFDGSAFQMALPVVQEDFHAPLSSVQWTMTAFLLVSTSALLPVGRAGDVYGRETVFRAGVLGFVFASLACALSRGLPLLIAGRAAQGLAASLIVANSAPILVRAFPDKSGTMLGLGNIALAAGMMSGPPAGALLTRYWSWRAIFLAAVPVGAWVWWASSTTLPRPERGTFRLDLSGGLLAVLGLGGVLLGSNLGDRLGWSSWQSVASFAAGLVLLAAFFVVEAYRPEPTLRLGLFRDPTFTAGMVGASFAYAALFAGTTALPFLLLRAQHRSLLEAGLLVGVVPITMSLVAPFAGRFTDRVGSRWPCTAALGVLATALLLVGLEGPGARTVELGLYLALAGAAVGGFESPNDLGVLKSVRAEELGVATATLSAARNLGMTAGTALATLLIAGAARANVAAAEEVARGTSRALLAGAAAAALGAVASIFRRR